MKIIILYAWGIITTVTSIYFGMHFMKTDYQTLYMGLDKLTSNEISRFLDEKRQPYIISSSISGVEIMIAKEKVKTLREELGSKIICSKK